MDDDNDNGVREAWHKVFGGTTAPNKEAREALISESGNNVELIYEAFEVCAHKINIISFNSRMAYIRGILRNKTSGGQ